MTTVFVLWRFNADDDYKRVESSANVVNVYATLELAERARYFCTKRLLRSDDMHETYDREGLREYTEANRAITKGWAVLLSVVNAVSVYCETKLPTWAVRSYFLRCFYEEVRPKPVYTMARGVDYHVYQGEVVTTEDANDSS